LGSTQKKNDLWCTTGAESAFLVSGSIKSADGDSLLSGGQKGLWQKKPHLKKGEKGEKLAYSEPGQPPIIRKHFKIELVSIDKKNGKGKKKIRGPEGAL